MAGLYFFLSRPPQIPDSEAPMTETEFNALAAQGYNCIPLIAEAYAGLDTPLAIYLRLAHSGPEGGRNSCLLESVVGGERFGRYSFIGLPAKTVIRSRGTTTEVVHRGNVVETHEGDPLAFIEAYQARFKVALRPGLPRFCGGLAGYFGYDAVRYMEHRLARVPGRFAAGGGLDTPDILLLHTEELAVIDNLSGRLYLIVYADPAQPGAHAATQRRLAELNALLARPVSAPAVAPTEPQPVQRSFDKDAYLAAV